MRFVFITKLLIAYQLSALGSLKLPVLGQKCLISAQVRINTQVGLGTQLLDSNLNKRKKGIFVINLRFLWKIYFTFCSFYFLFYFFYKDPCLNKCPVRKSTTQKLLFLNKRPGFLMGHSRYVFYSYIIIGILYCVLCFRYSTFNLFNFTHASN